MELLEIGAQGPTGYVQITEVRKASPNMHGNNHGTSADSIARGPPKGFLSRFADDEDDAQTLHPGRGRSGARARSVAPRLAAWAPGPRPPASGRSRLSGAPCRRWPLLPARLGAYWMVCTIRSGGGSLDLVYLCMPVYVSVRKSVGGLSQIR